MPSTRGIGSKMMCCCSPALFGAISVKFIFTEGELRTILRPADGSIIDGVAVLGQLHGEAELNRFLRGSRLELVEEEV